MMWSARRVRGLEVCAALLLLGFVSPAGASSGSESYAEVRDAYLELRQDRERQRFRHNYLRIIEDFESFVSNHSDHERAPAALYNAGQLAWDLYRVSRVAADLRRSRDFFLRLANEYSDDSLADDGLFLSGRILLEHGGDPTEAYATFQSVIDRFPSGDMTPKAREILLRLSDHAPAEREISSAEGTTRSKASSARVVARSEGWQGRAGDRPALVGSPSAEVRDDLVRIQVPVSGLVRHRQGEVPSDAARGLPRRIYLDLEPATLDAPAFELPVDQGSVSRVRLGQFSSSIVRLVLDLRECNPVEVFPLFAEEGIILDVTPHESAAPDPIATLIAPETMGSGSPRDSSSERIGAESLDTSNEARVRQMRDHLKSPQEVPLSVQAGLKVRRVVIDPGHGGRDVGAVGPSGLHEKDVVLAISKKLGEKLSAHGLEVVYTRTEDVFVPLEARTAVANDVGADLFISIHANATSRRDRRGVSTYYLDVTSDRYSIRLAARENATTERSVGELQLILADLATRHNTDESARLAARIQGNLVQTLSGRYSDVRDLGVRYALFFVLLGARMPSVLVETSFMSNPVEEQRLADPVYRDHVAEGIFNGIRAFLDDRNRIALGE